MEIIPKRGCGSPLTVQSINTLFPSCGGFPTVVLRLGGTLPLILASGQKGMEAFMGLLVLSPPHVATNNYTPSAWGPRDS